VNLLQDLTPGSVEEAEEAEPDEEFKDAIEVWGWRGRAVPAGQLRWGGVRALVGKLSAQGGWVWGQVPLTSSVLPPLSVPCCGRRRTSCWSW